MHRCLVEVGQRGVAVRSLGVKFRTANLKDDCTRECPAIDVAFSIPGERVVEMLERAARERGYPDRLVVDNGPELRGRVMERWAFDHRVELYFIDPGKPTQNAYIESFNGRFREECPNLNWFTSLEEARAIIEEWRVDYNEERPHSSIGYLTPSEFAAERARSLQAHQKDGPSFLVPALTRQIRRASEGGSDGMATSGASL